MSDPTRRRLNPNVRFSIGLAIGLVIGVPAGVLTATLLHPGDRWTEAGGQWVRLPSQAPAGALPQTFATPAKAWDYGATTRALPATVTAKTPVIVRVDVSDVSGPVGVSLAKPDGSALISKEKLVPTGPGQASLYFRQAAPADIAVLVRNYNGDGKPGSVTVRAVRYAAEASLSNRSLGEVNKAGVN